MFGEVNRPFAVRWKDQLDHHWHLINRHGNLDDVVYNKNLTSPTIVHGCMDNTKDFLWARGRSLCYISLLWLVSVLANHIQNLQWSKKLFQNDTYYTIKCRCGTWVFPNTPPHAQHFLGLVREQQMVGDRSRSEGEVPGTDSSSDAMLDFNLKPIGFKWSYPTDI